jgi:hypothetical protein
LFNIHLFALISSLNTICSFFEFTLDSYKLWLVL